MGVSGRGYNSNIRDGVGFVAVESRGLRRDFGFYGGKSNGIALRREIRLDLYF